MAIAAIDATAAAATEPCRERSAMEGIQIQPIALVRTNKFKEAEEIIPVGNQTNEVATAPDATAIET